MDYTGTSGTTALAVGGGTLAYTGANDMTTIWLILGLLLITIGATLLIVMSRRNRRDAHAAGITMAPPNNDLS